MQDSGGGRMAEPFTGEDEQTPEARIAGVFSVWAVGRAVGDLAAACGNSTHHHNTDSECHAETPTLPDAV
jgi:hypothetical protein